MRLIAILIMLMSTNVIAETSDPAAFVKKMPYGQIIKDMVFSRCIAQVADENSPMALDAAQTANALREWIPYDIETGDQKVNSLIAQFKDAENNFYSESKSQVKGVTLNCLRLYHSDELNKLVSKLLIGNPKHTWLQDNSTR